MTAYAIVDAAGTLGAGSSDGPEEHTIGSEEHSYHLEEGRMQQMRRAVGSECCRPLHKAGMEFDVHYLQRN